VIVEHLEPSEVFRSSREALGLPPDGGIDEIFLAAALRRAAANLGPCPRSTLAASIRDSLRCLDGDPERTGARIDDVLESLTVTGDLAELSRVSTHDTTGKASWLFPAPPSFLLRPSGTVLVFGITPDDIPILPAVFANRIMSLGCLRLIRPEPGEDLLAIFASLGLMRRSEKGWLRSPRQQSAEELIANLTDRLMTQPASGSVDELEILDGLLPAKSYRARWTGPKGKTGAFVGRRPQTYGAPLWCFVHLDDGEPTRFLDFPLPDAPHFRGCDDAWHLQMAMDFCRSQPQSYHVSTLPDGHRFDFFSPLPLWAERRLSLCGEFLLRQGSRCSYRLPEREAATEEDFLKKRLWLVRSEGASSTGEAT
jgi:hypothetical protein